MNVGRRSNSDFLHPDADLQLSHQGAQWRLCSWISSEDISSFVKTRSYATLRAADLDWVVGPGYSSGRYILDKNQHGTMNNHKNQPGPMKKQKRYERGVTTDL